MVWVSAVQKVLRATTVSPNINRAFSGEFSGSQGNFSHKKELKPNKFGREQLFIS